MTIQAQHTIENGLMTITEYYRIPISFIENGIDLKLAQSFGYQQTVSVVLENGLEGFVENPQHPVDFILDFFHKQLESGAKAIIDAEIKAEALAQAQSTADNLFNQLMGS